MIVYDAERLGCAARTRLRRLRGYVAYENGEEEYYDLAADPHQLDSKPQDTPPDMEDDLEDLEGCSGDGCREAESP